MAPGLAEGGNHGIAEEEPIQVVGRTQLAGMAVGNYQHNGDQIRGVGGSPVQEGGFRLAGMPAEATEGRACNCTGHHTDHGSRNDHHGPRLQTLLESVSLQKPFVSSSSIISVTHEVCLDPRLGSCGLYVGSICERHILHQPMLEQPRPLS